MAKAEKTELDKEADRIIGRFSQTLYARYMLYFHAVGILWLLISMLIIVNFKDISSNLVFTLIFWLLIAVIFVLEPIIALFYGVTFPISVINRPLQGIMYLAKVNRPLQFYLDVILKVAIALFAIVWVIVER